MKNRKEKITSRKLRSSYITTVISISLVLFLLGVTGFLLLNANKISDYVKENINFDVILKENVKEVDIIRLQKDLDATRYVKSTRYITKQQATDSLIAELGENFVEFLGYSPLLPSIEVNFLADYANNDSIAIIEKELAGYEQIHEVWYDKSQIHELNENIRSISLIMLIFSGLLFLISFTLINNTIRLSVYSKRFIINTMKLVGATSGFIRWPFLLKSVLTGLVGAFIAIGMLVGVIYLAQKEMSDVVNFMDLEIIAALFMIVILLGILITWISTFFAVNKYLRLRSSDLYY